MATATVQWTQQGVTDRSAYMTRRVAVADQYQFVPALTDAIRAWALMTLTARNPGPQAAGAGDVSYASATPPSPKSTYVAWTCTVASWSPANITLQVTAVR